MTYMAIEQKLRDLESKLNNIKIPPYIKASLLNESLKWTKKYLTKLLGEKKDFFPTHWASLKKSIMNATRISQKKDMIQEEIQYIKHYIMTKKDSNLDSLQHTDILYIYWHSKTELQIINQINVCLNFLDQQITELENTLLKNHTLLPLEKRKTTLKHNNYKLHIKRLSAHKAGSKFAS